LIDWGVLKETEEKGIYKATPRKEGRKEGRKSYVPKL
jgi:hypothetical protein